MFLEQTPADKVFNRNFLVACRAFCDDASQFINLLLGRGLDAPFYDFVVGFVGAIKHHFANLFRLCLACCCSDADVYSMTFAFVLEKIGWSVAFGNFHHDDSLVFDGFKM